MSFTAQQINHARMLLQVLRSALDEARTASSTEAAGSKVEDKERAQAISNLSDALRQMESAGSRRYDLKLSVLLRDLKKRVETVNALKSVLPQDLPPTLSSFGLVPSNELRAAFSTAGIECPFVLRVFHAEYQEQIHVLSNLSKMTSPLPTAKPK